MICHYWFFNHEFKFQDSACNGWNDLTMLGVHISNIAIINVKNVDYRFIVHNISKSEAVKLLKHSVLEDCEYISKNIVLNFILLKAVFSSLFLFCYT